MTGVAQTGTLVVGGSIGGVRTVQQLRRLGYDDHITLVEAEPHPPYDRPPLSKEVLLDDDTGAPTLLDPAKADELGVELLLGRAARAVRPAERQVELHDGQVVTYHDALVVATGARARRSPWTHPTRVLVLRTWDDAERLRDVLVTARSLVIVGAGFIGSEVAAAARRRGVSVDLVDVLALPMARHLGDEVAELFVDLHRRHGVATHFGTAVDTLAADGHGVEVGLSDGTELRADAAVVGLGTELNLEWLRDSSLRLDDGLVCDAFGRAHAQVDIYGVGDVARWWHPGLAELSRSEHWTNAVEQAAVVAHNIAHPDDLKEHSPVGYVWSNQYDWKVQIAGRPGLGVAHHRVDGTDGQFAVLYGDAEGLLCGVLTVNWPSLSVRGRKSLASKVRFGEAVELMLPGQSLPDLARAGARPR
jgi:3-phenylpropionate/trans-cinnamate dioxygenase ferredoxin reductase component